MQLADCNQTTKIYRRFTVKSHLLMINRKKISLVSYVAFKCISSRYHPSNTISRTDMRLLFAHVFCKYVSMLINGVNLSLSKQTLRNQQWFWERDVEQMRHESATIKVR